MAQDFITDFLYHLFSEDKKEHPIPSKTESNLLSKIRTVLTPRNVPVQNKKEG